MKRYSPFDFPIAQILLDEAPIDGGGGSGSPALTPAAATPAAPASAPATFGANASPATQGTPPPATGGSDDRSNWVPSYRVREAREAAERASGERWSRQEQQYKSELEAIRSQLHALVGVKPAADPEVSNIRSQFGSLYPGLAKLEDRAQELMGVLERAGDYETSTNHYWQQYGRQTMDRLFEKAQGSLGSPLTEEGRRSLHSSFVGWVQSSPELQQRYATDPSIVEDYWQQFTSSFIEPVRRGASAQVAGRAGLSANLPQDRAASAPPVTGAPKPANLDERAAQAWASYTHNART